jgi:purine-binding chemotaxis protein CheW
MAMTNTYLSFSICQELYAVTVDKVLEVLEKQPITYVPNTPEVIKGIINFRGEVVPIFETRVKFNLPVRDSELPYVIVVLDLSKDNDIYRVGAIVDKVKDVIIINDDEIKPVPTMSKDFNADFLTGIVKRESDFIMLIDVEKVFTTVTKNEIKEVLDVNKLK